jgi:hypothetical protein
MCIIDEKQEAIARIRMAIDNERKLHLEPTEDNGGSELALDLESESSNMWQLGSPEGKKMNLRAMAADYAKTNPQYCSLDERLRNFIACNLAEEAVQMRFEDDIYVSFGFQFRYDSEDMISHNLTGAKVQICRPQVSISGRLD